MLPLWVRRLLALAQGVGGGLGVFVVAVVLLRNSGGGFFVLGCVLGIVAFLYGMVLAVALLENRPDAERLSAWYWTAQIPIVQTPLIGGFFASGALVQLSVQWDPLRFSAYAYLGSAFNFTLYQSGASYITGVNVLALGVAAYLWSRLRANRPALAPSEGSDIPMEST